MGNLREEEISGSMTQEFADEYSEENGYYYDDKRGRCQNPQCGHYPIFHRHILRNPISGDVKEIGSYCYQRWRKLRGLENDPWFYEYERQLRIEAGKRSGQRISQFDLKRIEGNAYHAWLLEQVKEKKIKLIRQDQPLQNFKTREEAEKWVHEIYGGYCDGTTSIGVKSPQKFWIIYINPEFKGDY